MELKKTLSLSAGTGLAITLVVGSGLLVLPGIAYARFGEMALSAWVVCSIAIIPALVVFARLGARFPGAGGMALFVISGNYAGAATSSGMAGQIVGILVTTVLVSVIVLCGGKVSGNVNRILAAVLVLGLAMISGLALMLGKPVGSGAPAVGSISSMMNATALIFFAFVGWEVLSFTSEEFRNPRRDFPLAIAISYVLVVGLYVLIAYSIGRTLKPTDALVSAAPFVALIETTGIRGAGMIVGILGYFITCSNIMAVCWAFSRLLFSSAREGLMPSAFAKLSVRTQVPVNAVIAALVLFLIPVLPVLRGVVGLPLLFALSGSCFLFAYVLVCTAFIRLERGWGDRVVAVLAAVIAGIMLMGFGWVVIYPLGLFGGAYGVFALKAKYAGASAR